MPAPSTSASFTANYTPSLTANFDGSAGIPPVTGTLSATLDSVNGLVSGLAINAIGTLSVNLDDVTGVIYGESTQHVISVTVNFAANYTPSTHATFGNPPVESIGYLSATLDDVTGPINGRVVNCIGSLSVDLDDVTGVVAGDAINVIGSLSCALDDVSGLIHGEFDIAVKRYITTRFDSGCINAEALTATTTSLSSVIVPSVSSTISKQTETTPVIPVFSSDTSTLISAYTTITSGQQFAQAIEATIASYADYTVMIYVNAESHQSETVAISNDACALADVLQIRSQATASTTVNLSSALHSPIQVYYTPSTNDYVPELSATFSQTGYVPSLTIMHIYSTRLELREGFFKGVLPASLTSAPRSTALERARKCSVVQRAIRPPIGKSPHIDLPRPPPTPPPSHGETITIPTRTVYSMQHSISVVTYPNNVPIPLSKVSLSYDVDSYAWTFSGVLADKSSLALVTMTNDVPVQLSITVNGYNWRVLVESIEQARSFGKLDINLKGRSLSALLGAPYQLQMSYTAGSNMTVQQLADALLPNGWTINWQCATPWLVPANAYSYTQQTRLQALASLAQNIGAVLIPSRNDQTLTMMPRYPVLPWNFNAQGINANLVITESAIITVNTASRTQSPINAVYVHGGENGGVLARCRLNGTAGDVLASTESNPLITDVVGARALGERILAGKATQPIITALTMPLGGDFVLAEVGELVEVVLGGVAERAIINGVSISVEFGRVSQSITVGEQTTNAYSKLLNLLPSQPLLVGQLVSTYNEISILTLLDGGVITARGTGTVGQNYYVRNGLIESAAPNLIPNEIVI